MVGGVSLWESLCVNSQQACGEENIGVYSVLYAPRLLAKIQKISGFQNWGLAWFGFCAFFMELCSSLL